MVEFTQYDSKKQKKLESKLIEQQLVWPTVIKQLQIYKNQQRCVIINASTGLGKSTYFVSELFKQFPDHVIICSQLTVVNTISLAQFVAQNTEGLYMGKNIGFSTSLQSIKLSQKNGIIFQTLKTTTLSYLIALQKNTLENPQNHIIIIDEVHANDINMHEQLAIIKNLLNSLPFDNLPLFIIQSGSIDPFQYMEYFGINNYIAIKGSRHEVTTIYIDEFKRQQKENYKNNNEQILNVCEAIAQARKGVNNIVQTTLSQLQIKQIYSALIFVPKVKQINELKSMMYKSNALKGVLIYGISSKELQENPNLIQQIDNESFKIIIATNVIETGFTIKYLTFVIDTLKFYQIFDNPISRIQYRKVLPIDQNMIIQRKGRVGRTNKGIYIPLTTKELLIKLPAQREFMIQIQDLDGIINQFGIDNFLKLKFLKQIPAEQIIRHLQNMLLFNSIQPKTQENQWLINLMLGNQKIFKNTRRIICMLLALQYNFPIIDIIIIFTYIDSNVRFNIDRSNDINDCKQIVNNFLKFNNPQFMQILNQNIEFFQQHNINIYSGYQLTCQEQEWNDTIKKIFSIAFFEFKFKYDKGYYCCKNGLKIKQILNQNANQPQIISGLKNLNYFVCIQLYYDNNYNANIIIPISKEQYEFPSCQNKNKLTQL